MPREILRNHADPAFQERAQLYLEQARAKVKPDLLKKYNRRLESLEKLVRSHKSLTNLAATQLSVISVGQGEQRLYRRERKNTVEYRYFKEMRLTELCNECEAIMAGKLQYGSVCKRCQKKYDEALKRMALQAKDEVVADVKGFWASVKEFFS